MKYPEASEITVNVKGEGRNKVLYRFRVSEEEGVLVVDNMYGNLDKAVIREGIGSPLPMNELQGEFVKSRGDLFENIKYITQESIANEKTQNLLKVAFGKALENSKSNPISLTSDGLSGDAFRAMLNTPNVQPTARMLSTYPKIGKKIIEIRIQGMDRITLVLGAR
ncbi:hypothetical protein [Burkholderia oklahomensis]|uniref:hypothetical protein n=1 Tax=Burkholderia oklahomensis TaxID=342113 RepID=UPI0012FD3CE6|nr:hypothetical protein [Burkholderia oklahomensis]